MELPSCRFSHSGVLGRTLSDTDDDILEVAESNEANEENTSGIEASTSNSEDPAGKVPSKKICCPICLDDEETVSKKDLTCLISTFNFLYSKNPFFFFRTTLLASQAHVKIQKESSSDFFQKLYAFILV